MAQLGPITVTVSVSLGTTALPVKPITFDVPLQSSDSANPTEGAATFSIDLDRTELRKQLTKSVRTLADQVEGVFLASDTALVTCEECGAQIAAQQPASLRHEALGAHTLVTPTVTARARFTGNESLRAEETTAAAETTEDEPKA